MKRIAALLLAAVALGLGVAFGVLGWAHWTIRAARPELPEAGAIAAALAGTGRPQRVSYVNTATQRMPRSTVLDPGADPRPDQPYVMSHPSFVVEWPDNRLLLVDTGMTRAGAIDFGRVLETLGAEAIQPLDSAAVSLGEACSRVRAIVFTHLHSDHVDGITELCRCAGHRIDVFMSEAQASITNHTTSGGLARIRDSECVDIRVLDAAPIAAVPGYPGIVIAHAGGHTPGSQAVFIDTDSLEGPSQFAIAGDIANNLDGIAHNVPKPYFYSLLIVPEDRDQLDAWRQFLKQMGSNGFGLLVDHDQLAIEALKLPKFAP